jgi:hypothetical protein
MSNPEKVILKLLNVLGEELFVKEIANTQQGVATFDLTGFTQGIYLVALQTAHSEKTLKISLLH